LLRKNVQEIRSRNLGNVARQFALRRIHADWKGISEERFCRLDGRCNVHERQSIDLQSRTISNLLWCEWQGDDAGRDPVFNGVNDQFGPDFILFAADVAEGDFTLQQG